MDAKSCAQIDAAESTGSTASEGASPASGTYDSSAPLGSMAVIARRYRVIGTLGAGGMGIVHLARDEFSGAKVALKLMRRELVHEATLCARVKREAEALARIAHRNVVRLLAHGEDPTLGPFLAFEHLEGESLADRLDRDGPLAAHAAVRVVEDVLAALAAAHEAGVIHRDLKPENVFLTVGGEAPVKVLDFGISRVLLDHEAAEDQRLTRSGTIVGTPVYMSPEQALGNAIDTRADLYSAGVVLYEALSGALPHPGENYNQVLAHVVGQPPQPLRDVAPDIDPALATLVHRALAYSADERFPTAAAFGRALRNWRTLGHGEADRVTEPALERSFAEVSSAPTPVPQPARNPKRALAFAIVLVAAVAVHLAQVAHRDAVSTTMTAQVTKAPGRPPVTALHDDRASNLSPTPAAADTGPATPAAVRSAARPRSARAGDGPPPHGTLGLLVRNPYRQRNSAP